MLTLAAYVGYARRRFSLLRYLAVVVLFALGLMAKPMLVTLPFVLLLLDYWPLGRTPLCRWNGDSWFPRSAWEPTSPDAPRPAGRSHAERGNEGQTGPFSQQSWSRLIVEKLPLLALSAGSCAVTVWAQRNAIIANQQIEFPSRFANAVASLLGYLVQWVYPANLAAMYPFPLSGVAAGRVAAAALVLSAISLAVLIAWRRYPCLLVGWLWYLGMLVPVIGLVQVGSQAMADRYTYLPQIGLAVGLVWLAARFVAASPRWRAPCVVVASLILLDLIVVAWQQTWYWRDSKTLWAHALDCTTDNWTAHEGLGSSFLELHQYDDAIAEFNEALRIRPGSAQRQIQPWYGPGTPWRAWRCRRRSRRVPAGHPLRPDSGRCPLQPRRPAGQSREDRRSDCRVSECAAVQARPRQRLLQSCHEPGPSGQACRSDGVLREALRLEPNNVDTVDEVAWRLATSPDASIRDGRQALDLARRAVRLSHGDVPRPLGTLAAAYAEVGQFSEAVETARRAIDLAVRLGDGATEEELRAQINVYRANRPYHESPGQPQ